MLTEIHTAIWPQISAEWDVSVARAVALQAEMASTL